MKNKRYKGHSHVYFSLIKTCHEQSKFQRNRFFYQQIFLSYTEWIDTVWNIGETAAGTKITGKKKEKYAERNVQCTCSAFFLSFYVDFCNKNLNSIKTSANATAKKELLNTDNQ